MKALSPRLAWRIFVAAIVFLALFVYLGDQRAQEYASSEEWVEHTLNVEVQIARVGAELGAQTGIRYQVESNPASAERFTASVQDMNAMLDQLQQLTADNPVQQENIDKLRGAIGRRTQLMAQNLRNATTARSAADVQVGVTNEAQATAEVTSILSQMREEEERLLGTRTIISDSNLRTLRIVLALGTAIVFGVLIFAFRTLLGQLALRGEAERAIRRLNAHILRIQDAERRRLARELHDGVGQVFAGLSMELETLAQNPRLDGRQKEALEGATALAKEGLSQTRTISYLLHPPMLEEFGLEQAVKWYVEGFAKRSEIEISTKFSQPFKRLPEAIELVLFRVIQEALTNVHRHSGSKRAEIIANLRPERVTLIVRDFGKGIAGDLLQRIERSSSGAGVGLGGMRERIAELGGHLALDSSPQGTTISVSMPFPLEQGTRANGDPTALAEGCDTTEKRAERPGLDDSLSRAALDY